MHIRPTLLHINLGAIRHNLRAVRRHAPLQQVCAVVKADAYGHGLVPVAQALSGEGVDWLATALVEEGVALRQAGLQEPILVMAGAYKGAYDTLLAHNLVPAIFSREHLAGLAKAAGERPAFFHLKVDTGMARLGLRPWELENFLKVLAAYPNLRLQGVLTHFANADLEDFDFNAEQLRQFERVVERLQAVAHAPLLTHIANSAGVMTFQQAHVGLLRPGIMLYGVNPMPKLSQLGASLRLAMRWTTRPVQIKQVPKGHRVSYGGRWVAPRDSLIATLPVGYADGYSRTWSGKASVLVRGARVPVVGTICMDLCLADVTDLPEVTLDDEVVLLGHHGSTCISPSEVAGWNGTIPYEVICTVGSRVPRIYQDSHD